MEGRGVLRFRIAVAVAAMSAALLVAFAEPALAGGSSCGGPNWYGYGKSGSGALGNDVWMSTPSTWSIYSDNNSTSAASSWLIQGNVGSNVALETGWYSGYFPYAPYNWDPSHLIPYYTINNGPTNCSPVQCGHDNELDRLPTGTGLHFTSRQGSSGYIEIGWNTSYDWVVPLNYPISNGLNYMQGEVRGHVDIPSHTASWMGNGPSPNGYQMNGYYCVGACTSWGSWGYINTCNDYPYSATGQGTATDWISGPNW